MIEVCAFSCLCCLTQVLSLILFLLLLLFLVFEILDRVPAINIEGGEKLPDLRGLVQLEDVSFNYPSRPTIQVLATFSLELRPGTVTALVC